MINFDQAVQKNVLPGLDILVSGTIPPNPSELMCSSTFISLVEQLKEEYDYIIFDTPPIGVVADALLLKELIAGFIVVVRERATTHGDLRNLTESIKLADSRVLGIVKVGCSQNGEEKASITTNTITIIINYFTAYENISIVFRKLLFYGIKFRFLK